MIFLYSSGHSPPDHPETCVYCPYFSNTSSVVKTSVGIPVNLTCGVRNLGESQVRVKINTTVSDFFLIWSQDAIPLTVILFTKCSHLFDILVTIQLHDTHAY